MLTLSNGSIFRGNATSWMAHLGHQILNPFKENSILFISLLNLLCGRVLNLDCLVLCRQYRNSSAKKKFVPWPIEIRFCEDSASQNKPRYWVTIFSSSAAHLYLCLHFILPWPKKVLIILIHAQ
jgi:hypothetical protein